MLSRRNFLLRTTAVAGVVMARPCVFAAEPKADPFIMTVTGPVPARDLDTLLTHEHVTTDFIGAEKFSQPRYDPDEAFERIRPHFEVLKRRGVTALFECTPNHIGRDVRLLKRLSESTGVRIITNTGYYGAVGNKFLPAHAHEETAGQLAERWLKEWTDGIEGTGIRPGFIKLGTERGALSPLHTKLVQAAARVHQESGLTICIHTGDGVAALDELRILDGQGVAPEAFVWVHAQNDAGPTQNEVARKGGWVSLDGYSLATQNPKRYLNMLIALKEAGCWNRVLVSHDDGWAVEGEGERSTGLKPFGNGNPEPYMSVFTRLVPDLEAAGFSNEEIRQLMTVNPRNAFAIRVRTV